MNSQTTSQPTAVFRDAADGALGYDDLLNPPDRPTLVTVGPWDFEAGDSVVLFAPGRRTVGIAETPQTAAGVEKTVSFYIAGKALAALGSGIHDFVVDVLREGTSVASTTTQVAIWLDRPGIAPDGTNSLATPRVSPTAITPTTAGATVSIDTYANMRAGDTITTRWGAAGNEVSRVITASDVGGPVDIAIARALIDAGGTGQGINVSYTVKDDSGDMAMSPSTNVNVAGASPLNPPTISQVTLIEGDYVLDVDALLGAPARMTIAPLERGDVIIVHLAGTTADGLPIEYTGPEVTAAQTFSRTTLPNDVLASLMGGDAAVWYERKRGDAVTMSDRFNFSIVGKPASLVAPDILEAEGDSLDPEKVLVAGKATLAIPYSPLMKPGTRVRYLMHGTATDGTTIMSEGDIDITATSTFPLRFDILSNEINALNGSTVTFTYKLLVYSGAPGKGKPVQSIQAPERTYRLRDPTLPVLPAAIISQADGDTIDPAKIDNNLGTRVIVNYPGMQSGDRITLYWYGSIDRNVYKKTLTSLGSALTFLVPKEPFLNKNVGSTVTVLYTVERDDETFNAEIAEFNVGIRLRDLTAPTIDGSAAGKLDIGTIGDTVIVRLPAGLTFQAGDLISVSIGEYTTTTRPATDGMTFEIPVTEFARYLGQRVPVIYTLTRGGLSYASDPAFLDVARTGRSRVALDFKESGIYTGALPINTPISFVGGAVKITALGPFVGIGQDRSPTGDISRGSLYVADTARVQIEIVGEPVTHIQVAIVSNVRTAFITTYSDDGTQTETFARLGWKVEQLFDHTSRFPIRRLIIGEGGSTIGDHHVANVFRFVLE
ncbi:hypothetical protein IM816_04325 [Luteibacter flocculans]|uniref:Uncharacterized protein n=1 Tax=Luteibacter flocculans TaxID=2780091 RepID=A0ABY4T336_9GAMM|nr:hypothetical protein [Luteibacter flocculans]URL59343.1 hypothetical protein IM816_04325 [Luteibacter flocculans]